MGVADDLDENAAGGFGVDEDLAGDGIALTQVADEADAAAVEMGDGGVEVVVKGGAGRRPPFTTG